MGLLIDSSVLIAYEKNRLNLNKHLDGRSDRPGISVISASELLHGVYRAIDPVVREKRLRFVEAVIQRFPVLTIDLSLRVSTRCFGPSWRRPGRP